MSRVTGIKIWTFLTPGLLRNLMNHPDSQAPSSKDLESRDLGLGPKFYIPTSSSHNKTQDKHTHNTEKTRLTCTVTGSHPGVMQIMLFPSYITCLHPSATKLIQNPLPVIYSLHTHTRVCVCVYVYMHAISLFPQIIQNLC